MSGTAVLLMAFGGPESLDEIGPFMSRLMGRPPAPPILERVAARYRSIGGGSPLPRIVRRQAQALESLLAQEALAVPARAAFKYATPSIGDAVRDLAREGYQQVVGVSLSPHFAQVSTGAYLDELRASAEENGIDAVWAGPFYAERHFLDGLAERVRIAIANLSDPEKAFLIFGAHSLPEVHLESDTTYVDELGATVNGVLDRLPGHDWRLAYQSKGVAAGKWLEPEVDTVLEELAERGRRQVALVPIGFTSDHVETLYDIDIVIAGRARELGLEFVRAGVMNDADIFIQTLAAVVRPHLER